MSGAAARVARVVIVNDASTARGGATGLAILQARVLRSRGVPVTFFAGDDGAGEALRALGVEVVAVGGRGLVHEPPLRAATRGVHNGAARAALAGWIARRDGPGTVYHVHGWSKILSPSIFGALRPLARRTVVHAHDFFLACPNGAYMDYRRGEPCGRRPLGASCLATQCDKRSYGQKLWRVARQGALSRHLAGAPWAAVVMIHERMAPHLMRGGLAPDILTTLRNPVEPFTADRVPAERNRTFLFVGRVEAEKGVEDAVEAARRADVPLRVVGDGPLLPNLARRHPGIEFTGWRTRAELTALLADTRALVMPSRYPEPFGLVAVEAARSGVPVILARTAFLGDDVARHRIGLVCDTRDPARFADAIARLRDMPRDELRAMSERAFGCGPALSMTPGNWIDGLLSIYERAIAGIRPRAA